MALARSILSGQNGQCPGKRNSSVRTGQMKSFSRLSNPAKNGDTCASNVVIAKTNRISHLSAFPEPVERYRGEMNVSASNLIGVIIGPIERFFSEGIREDHDLEDRLQDQGDQSS